MNEDPQIAREAGKVMMGFRILGWGFLLMGSLAFIVFAFSTFDQKASIRINGVDTFDFSEKLGATAFTAVFPIIGAFLAFIPQKKFEPFLRQTMKQAKDLRTKPGNRK